MDTKYKLSPELGDGDRSMIVDNADAVVDAVKHWCVEFSECDGESFEVEVIKMTDAEFLELPCL